jgi:hypothetical protein
MPIINQPVDVLQGNLTFHTYGKLAESARSCPIIPMLR